MIISNKLINELKEIMKEEYNEDLDDDEAQKIGRELVISYEALIKLHNSKKKETA